MLQMTAAPGMKQMLLDVVRRCLELSAYLDHFTGKQVARIQDIFDVVALWHKYLVLVMLSHTQCAQCALDQIIHVVCQYDLEALPLHQSGQTIVANGEVLRLQRLSDEVTEFRMPHPGFSQDIERFAELFA